MYLHLVVHHFQALSVAIHRLCMYVFMLLPPPSLPSLSICVECVCVSVSVCEKELWEHVPQACRMTQQKQTLEVVRFCPCK